MERHKRHKYGDPFRNQEFIACLQLSKVTILKSQCTANYEYVIETQLFITRIGLLKIPPYYIFNPTKISAGRVSPPSSSNVTPP